MFRSTLIKIKKACARAAATSTCREKTCDGRFNRSPEVRKKAQSKTKFEEQRQKCMSIIDECFTPLETYQHKGEVEENRFLKQDSKKVDHGQGEKDKCEKILCQCFGKTESYERSAGTETDSYEETVETNQRVDESKREERPIQMVNERQVKMVKVVPAIESVEDGAQTTENPGAASGIRYIKSVGIDTCDAKKVKGESQVGRQQVIQKVEDESQIDKVEGEDKIQVEANRAAIEIIPIKKEVEDAIKSGKIDVVQNIDDEFQTEMTKHKKVTCQEIQHEIKPAKIAAIQKLDSCYQNETVKAEGHPGEYLNDLERQQIETDLRNIHLLKDTLLYNDLKPVDTFDIKRNNKGNTDAQSLPECSASTSDLYTEKPEEEIRRSDTLNIKLDEYESSSVEDKIRENLEQPGKVQYREVLQTAELHYKQLENVDLNNVAAEVQRALHKEEQQVDEESPGLLNFNEKMLEITEPEKPIISVDAKEVITQQETTKPSSKEQNMALHELGKQTNYNLSADPPLEYENSPPTTPRDEQIHQEPENFKISLYVIEPHLEAERPESVNSKEEKVELFETDKLKINTVKTGIQSEVESPELLVFKGENKEHQEPGKLKKNVDQENLELLCSKGEIEELGEAENVKINIVLAKNGTEALVNKSETHSEEGDTTKTSLKSVTHSNNSQIAPENTEIHKIQKPKGLEKTANPGNVHICNHAETIAKEIESNNKTMENNYTPQIDIAKELYDGQKNNKESKIGSEMSEQNNYTPQILEHTLDVVEPKTEDVGTQLSGLQEINKHIVVEAKDVHIRSYTKTKMEDFGCNNENNVLNNYTPQIEIANQIISDEKETKQNNEKIKIETQKTERDHYTPQIYLQILNFEGSNKENCNKEDSVNILNNIEPNKEEQIGIIDLEKRNLLRYTNTKMTELNHYSTQIYMDAILEARKVLQPHEKPENEKTRRVNKEPIIVVQSKEPLIEETNNQANLETLKYEAKLNIVKENANLAKSNKIRKNGIIFAQANVNAIDQSLNQMLRAKHNRGPRTSASKCYSKAPKHAEDEPTSNNYFKIQLPFEDTIKSTGNVDKAIKLHFKKQEVENSFKALKNEEDNYHNKVLHSTRDVGTSLIKEPKNNIKERSPASRLNIDRHGNLYKSRSPSRRHRHRLHSKDNVEILNKDNYYDKIAAEWIKNEERNVTKQFDDIASVYLDRHRRGESTRMYKMPKVEDEGFLAKSRAPKRNKKQRGVSNALVANCDSGTQNVSVRPRSSDEILKTYKDEDVSIELEGKISETCIATSETAPFLYNEEQIVMGDMSRGPLYFQPVTEKEETRAEQIGALETKADYNYHKKAIIKLISNISHLRGFLDEDKEPPKDTFNSYHDRLTKRHARLYKSMVDTVTKAEKMVKTTDAVKSAQESESNTTYYSAEDMSTHDMLSPKTHALRKNPDLSAKITLSSSATNTDLGLQNDPPAVPKKNSTNIKNVKLTTTVFNADVNASLNNNNCTAAWCRRNSLSVDALLRAIRNYSYGSTSKPFDTKHEGGKVSNGDDNIQQEPPDLARVHNQRDGSTQIQQNLTLEHNIQYKTQQSSDERQNRTILKDVNKTKVKQNELLDSFVEIISTEQEVNKTPAEEQQAIFRSVANYVKTDPEPKQNCTDRSYTNAIETISDNTAEETLPHVEQLSWEPHELEHTHDTKYSKPTDNISQRLTEQEQQYNNHLNFYERFLNYYEPKYEYAQQQFYNYYKSSETGGSINEKTEKQCLKQDDFEQKIQEQWSEQMRSYHNYYNPNGQHNENYYSYEQENNQYYPSGNRPADKLTNQERASPTNESQEANEYHGDDYKQNNPYFQNSSLPFYVTAEEFNDKFYEGKQKILEGQQYPQNEPCCYAQGVIPPPSANYVPPMMMIQKPYTMQPPFLDHQYTDPRYTNDENMYRNQNTQTCNSKQEKLRELESSYAYAQKEEASKPKVDVNIPVLMAETEKVKESEVPKEENDQATQETPSNSDNYCYYYLYQNPSTNQPKNEKQFNYYEDNISEKEQYNYNYDTTFDNMSNTKSDENAPKYHSQYHQESFKGKASDHVYYDASSNHMIPFSYMQNTHNCNCYQYYSTTPDCGLNEYCKKNANLQYPAYTHVSICPIDHKPGDKCEHCCAEDTSRPNELKADEVEMKSSEKNPKKANPEELRFAKPRVKKRRHANRGSGRGATESGIPKELELNTAINLPSLDEDVKLSELLERVRKRNRLLNMVELLKPYDPIQIVRCDDKDPPKPPDKPKTSIAPGKCPKCSPEPCRIPCPPGKPCDKNKPKDPCNRCETVSDKVTFMLYIGKKAKERMNPYESSDNTSSKSKAGVTQLFLTALVKLRKIIEGSDTSLNTSDSDCSKKTDYETLKRAEVVAEKFRPRFRSGRYSPIEHLKEGILHARKLITSGFSAMSQEDETFYDA